MEWIITIYFGIGIFKGIDMVLDDNPAKKPLWALTEKNPLLWTCWFCIYILGWPFIKR